MTKELTILANYLDSKGLIKEADYLDALIKSAVTVTQLQYGINQNKKYMEESFKYIDERISALEEELFGQSNMSPAPNRGEL